MSIDLVTLQILRERESYEKYHRLVPAGLLDQVTATILTDYGRYFKDFTAHTCIQQPVFNTAFFGAYHPKLTDEQRIHYSAVLRQCLETTVEPAVRANWVNNVIEQDYAARVMELLARYSDGGEVDIVREVTALMDTASEQLDRKKATKFVEDDIGALLADTEHKTGIDWRLAALRDYMRPLVGGDFGIVAGRPDTGKTTFLVSELTYMAKQIPEVFGNDRPILWLNNEGPGKRIKPRLYQAALDLSLEDMIALHKQGKLIDMYAKAVGAIDRIKILDVHGWSSYEVEDAINETRPSIVCFDMIDNIRFTNVNSGSRTDQVLEEMYKWGRIAAVKYDFVGIATSQISAEGSGLLFPSMSMLKDSKCFAAGTSIRMYDGSTRAIESIEVGEQVMGIDGTPRNVTGTGSGTEPMFRVSGKAWSFDCNLSHNLVVCNPTSKYTAGLHKGEVRDMPLAEFMAHPSYMQRLSAVRCRIPYTEQDLPIDPYLFGLWLGDGLSTGFKITTADKPIYDYLLTHEVTNVYRQATDNWLVDVSLAYGRKVLRQAGVWNNKHIPLLYKTSSIEQRKQLLAGLMDSDGYIDSGGSAITMAREHLIDDIEEIARSLGYRVSRRHKITNFNTDAYTVSFRNYEELPVLLDRKRTGCVDVQDSMTVEPLGEGTYYGITVDGDSRYCHEKYIALRNTGKQSACDFMVMIGRSDDFNSDTTRGIGVVKNKLRLEGKPTDPRAEVIFDGNRARYRDAIGVR